MLALLPLLTAPLIVAACSTDTSTTTGADGTSSSTSHGEATTVATSGDATTEATTAEATTAETTDATTAEPTSTVASQSDGQGVIAVRLEEVGGFFIEGFEIGLRFETAGGEVLASMLWTDFVESLGDRSLEAFYDSVLEQPVPAGQVVVLATVNVGAGPPPEVPDLDGDLRCRLDVLVPSGGTVDVEVSFDGSRNCLRQL